MNVRLMPDHLITLFSNYYLGQASYWGQPRGEDLVAWAVDRLVEGEDTPHLCVLAGEPSSILIADAVVLLRKALEEMNLPFLEDRKFVYLHRIRRISEDLLADRISAVDACDQIDAVTGDLRYCESMEHYKTVWEEWDGLIFDQEQLAEFPRWQYPELRANADATFQEDAKATARKFLARLSPRAEWAEQFKAMAASGEDKLLDEETQSLTEWEQKHWKW